MCQILGLLLVVISIVGALWADNYTKRFTKSEKFQQFCRRKQEMVADPTIPFSEVDRAMMSVMFDPDDPDEITRDIQMLRTFKGKLAYYLNTQHIFAPMLVLGFMIAFTPYF
jgi:hypothetical protein